MSSLRLDGQDVSPLEREGEEGDVLTEMDRQTEDFLGWGKETILSERQVVEKEENKNKETAFLVTRTDRQTLAFVVVGLIVSTRIGAIVARSHHCENQIETHFLGRSAYLSGWDNPEWNSLPRYRHGRQTLLLFLQVVSTFYIFCGCLGKQVVIIPADSFWDHACEHTRSVSAGVSLAPIPLPKPAEVR